VLGKERGAQWLAEKKRKEIKKEDIKLSGNPDFIPRGVSVFEEKQVELANLLKLTEIAPMYIKPATDPMGNTQTDSEGKPVMIPVYNLEEIAKRVGENMNFPDLEKLIPGLREEREKKEAQTTANKAGTSTPATPQSGLGRGTPPPSTNLVGNVPGAGGIPIINQRRQ